MLKSKLKWQIVAYESDRNQKPVEEFILKQEPQAQAKITHLIDLLEQYGSLLGMPHSKQLENNLYELRVRGKQEIRILYTITNSTIYLLHAFKKQSQKTPSKELRTALQRLDLI